MKQAPGNRRALRRVATRLAIVLGAMGVALLLAEIGLRVTGLRPPRWPEPLTPDIHRPADPPLDWELTPGAESRYLFYADAYGPERTVVARVNGLGWRGATVARQKPAGMRRVVCLGDSLTFGSGVQEDETWPVQLERDLTERLGAGAVQVLNWGVNGYDTRQEIETLARRQAEWSPDVAIVTFFVNDALDESSAKPAPAPAWKRWLQGHIVGDKPDAPIQWLRSVSWLAEFGSQVLSTRLRWMRRSAMERLYFQEGNPGWDEVRQSLRRGRDLCAAADARFLVVLYPPLQTIDHRLTAVEIHDIVSEFCRGEGIACLDLIPAFSGQPVERMWVHRFDMHPDARANAIAARAVAERLLADDMLGRP